MTSPLLTESDKYFWHDYIPFYESFFINFIPKNILEIGVFRGNSIRYLLERFPMAQILGVDIIERTPEWPIDPRFSTLQIDQGNVPGIVDFFSKNKFDLIIEDGSHHPLHQVTCLVHGIKSVNKGGIYILEDIHTSHPLGSFCRGNTAFPRGNALSTLLAIGHYKRIGLSIDEVQAEKISTDSLISSNEVIGLAEKIKDIHLYRRSHLPDKCWSCGSVDYEYSSYKCVCGENVFSDTDSMTFVIECN